MLLSEPMVAVLTTIVYTSHSYYLSASWPCTEPTFKVHILEKAADVAE
jgi:hypothetical protein